MVAFRATTFLLAAVLTVGFPTQPSDVIFTLTDINYSSFMVYSTPAHLATYGGRIQFNVTNPAVPYLTRCSAYGTHLQDMFYGEFIYTCERAVGATGDTTFAFSRPDNTIDVNQTFASNGSLSYLASGSGKANLECQTTTWTNPNWTIGNLYYTMNVDCLPTSLDIPANLSLS